MVLIYINILQFTKDVVNTAMTLDISIMDCLAYLEDHLLSWTDASGDGYLEMPNDSLLLSVCGMDCNGHGTCVEGMVGSC